MSMVQIPAGAHGAIWQFPRAALNWANGKRRVTCAKGLKGVYLMDIEKLIEAVKLCGSTPKVDQCKQCIYWAGGDMSKCIPRMTADAATALSTIHTLQAENEQLLADLKYEREHANAYHEECGQWEAENEKLRAELEQVRREREAAVQQLQGICDVCQHYTPYHNCGKCAFCEHEIVRDPKIPPVDNWEWCGQKEG